MVKMKDSGIKWLGEIPTEWSINRLRYLCDMKTGGTPEDKFGINLDAEGYPWITAQDMDESYRIKKYSQFINKDAVKKCRYKLFPKNSILLVCIASVGKLGMIKEKAYSNQQITAIMANDLINSEYLLYYIQSICHKIIADASSSVVPIVNTTYLKDLICILPSKMEQELIASFINDKINKIDDVINELNKQVEILEKYKKSLITETVTKGLNPNAQMKESGIDWIGSIPEHWNISKVKYNVAICNGKEIETEDGEVPVYGTGGAFKTTNKFLYKGESVLLGRKGTIDKPLLVDGEFWTVDTAFYTIMKDKLLTKMFYYLAICFDYKYYQTGSTVPSMTQTDLGNIYIPLCTKSEQNAIINYLDKKCAQIDEIIKDKQNQINKMEKYKKSLIYEYVTGKKRLKGAEELYV